MDYSDAEVDEDIIGAEDLFSTDDEDETKEVEKSAQVENAEVNAKPQKIKNVKKSVHRPRHKLDHKTLSGPNGLVLLKKSFENFKFKGVNNEKEDLTKIMEILKHWMCYQLFPKHNFETNMSELEYLGCKKIVQVQMKKFRLGINSWGEQEQNAALDSHTDEVNLEEKTDHNDFDHWWQQEMAKFQSDNEMDADEGRSKNPVNCTKSHVANDCQLEISLTDEQLKRIEQNKKLAEERKQKFLKKSSAE